MPDKAFFGRIGELSNLSTLLSAQKPSISVIYGRRRIGKSELVRQAVQNHNSISIEGIENASKSEQIAGFLFQLSQQRKEFRLPPRISRPSTWREVFMLLYEETRNSPCCLCFDEFQWMANYRKEIVADLKLVWDQYFSQISGMHLILCGSIASFMVQKVIRSSALYGRTDLHINLKPFTINETAAMLPERGFSELLEAHFFSGGVPKYLEILRNSPSVRLALQKNAFTESGYFFEEFDRIFISHFGKNPFFRKIITCLADNPYGLFRKQLAHMLTISEGGALNRLLDDLEAAGFILSYTPFDKGEISSIRKYFLVDAYFRFYFAFILPNKKQISSGLGPELWGRISQTSAFYAWMGRSFEYFCLQHARTIAILLGFNGINYSYGPFFRPAKDTMAGVKIDLVFNRDDNVVTLCEMKYSLSAIGLGVIAEVQKKVDAVAPYVKGKTIQKVLFTLLPPSSELVASGYFYRTISAQEFSGH